jgi:hypothetical protein
MSGPTYSGLSKFDLLDSAMSQPLSLTSTLFEEGKGGALESFGLGTLLRRGALPEEAPVQDGTDANGNAVVGTGDVYVPPNVGMRDALMGTWGDTPAQLEQRRQDAGALTEDQYKASPSFRKDIPYDPGMTETRAAALAAMDDAKKIREFYAQKRPIAAFLGSMAGQALDPINYVPVGGPLVKAAAIGRFGRIGGEALTASLDAAANTALFGIGTADARAQLGDDVSWQALISQIATAGLIGSAFGTIHGAIGARIDARRMAEAEQRLSTLQTTMESRIALNEGIDAIVRGEDVNLSPNATEPLARVADQLEAPAARSPGMAEPPIPDGFVRLYHSGSVGDGNSGRWVSTNREYASHYRSDLPLHYLDVPANDPRVNNPDIPEQGVKQGFTFNFETTPQEAAQLKEISRAKLPADLTVEPVKPETAPPQRPAIPNDSSLNRTASWVIRDKETKSPIMETFNPDLVDKLNTNKYEAVPIGQYLGEINGRPKPAPTIDTAKPVPEPRPDGIKQAEASVAKPEDTKALAAQHSVDPATGAFPEEAEVAQLATEGRLTPDDAATLAQAEADYHTGSAFAEALKSVVGCLI